MLEELKARFGAENITVFKQVSENLEILHVQLEQNNNPISVLLTHGLSNYKMRKIYGMVLDIPFSVIQIINHFLKR